MEHNIIKPCLVIWVRHGQRADHAAEEGKEETKVHEFQADSSLTELGKEQSREAGERIKKVLEELGYSGSPIKVVSSPLLRTLQTAAFLQYALTNSVETVLHTHDYLSANLKLRDGANPLTHGSLATDQDLLSTHLSSHVSSLISVSTHLPPLAFPDKNFSKRYTLGLTDLFTHHTPANTVLILVSHHKGIPEISRLKYHGHPEAKKLRRELEIERPSYCCTIGFTIAK